METEQLINTMWSVVTLDNQMKVVQVSNFDNRLFFGKSPVPGASLFDTAAQENLRQASVIIEGVQKAKAMKRNSCFVFQSTCKDGVYGFVSVHVEYRSDESLCLYLTRMHQEDMNTAAKCVAVEVETVLQTVMQSLPVGIEIFDGRGCLIETNAQALKDAGIDSKEQVLGLNLFDNPQLPEEVKSQLRLGQNVHFSMEYNYDKYPEFLGVSAKRGINWYEFDISVVKDNDGEIKNYAIICQDVTEVAQLNKKYESLYNQDMAILNALPVGVGVYSPDGWMLYANEANSKIFGIDREKAMASPINIFRSPSITDQLKDAIRSQRPIQLVIPYDFQKALLLGHIATGYTDVRQIEFNGQPVLNAAGDMERYVIIMEDITKMKEKEENLRQSRHKTEIAMKSSDIMLWEFDVATRRFYSENEPLNDYDQSVPITVKQYMDTIHPDTKEEVRMVMERMSAGEDFSFCMDTPLYFPTLAEWQYCTISASPYGYDKDGTVLKFVGVRKNNTLLHKKKELLDKILNTIPLSILIKDVEDNYRYIFCNDECKRMLGKGIENSIYDVMEADEVDRIRRSDLEVFKTGKSYWGTERVILKDGRKYDTTVQKSIIEDNGKRLVLSVRWDQSLENDLQRRSKLLTMTLENMGAFTWFYEPDKEHINFGDGFDRVGLKAADVNTLSKYVASVHPDDRRFFLGSLSEVVAKDSGLWSVECRVDLDGNGDYKWYQARGILETAIINDLPTKYMFGMTINIDSHKKTEMLLRQSKEVQSRLIRQNGLILNNTNSGLAYISSDYVVQWENISVCSASLSFEAYKKGEHCYRSAHKRNTPCENCVLQRAFRSKQMEQIQFTLENNRRVEVFATPVFGNEGSVDGIVIRVDDITDREKMIEELRQAKAMAEQSDKLKSAFLANMSHEIRTPLNAIIGFSELLMITTDVEEKKEYMEIINNNNGLLLKLINDILDLSRIEAGSIEFTYEEFELSEYFDSMATSMKKLVSKPNVRLVVVNPYTSCKVSLDRNRVLQLMTNYVTNAIKFTPKGFIEMGYVCVENGIKFYVKDSGIGIPQDKTEKVFHRFAKLDEFAQGTGLGLSICKAIAESMGGNVGIESVHGEGSLFWVFLPCTPKVELSNDEMNKDFPNATLLSLCGESPMIDFEGEASVVRRTILVAEDIPSNYLLVSTILQKYFTLLHAKNGVEAVEMAATQQVDLLLMDMKMPIMDGLTATSEIRKFNKEMPIVALTAHAFESDRLAAMGAGCNDYLVKPIDKNRLMAVLQKYCALAGDKNQ